jgi:hypothetical protein
MRCAIAERAKRGCTAATPVQGTGIAQNCYFLFFFLVLFVFFHSFLNGMNCFVKLNFIVSNRADTTKPRISNLTAMLTNGLSWQKFASAIRCTISSDNSENDCLVHLANRKKAPTKH